MNNKHYVVRTKMADAMIAAAHSKAESGPVKSAGTRKVIRQVLTNEAKGVGVKFDSRKGNKKVTADSAVKEAA